MAPARAAPRPVTVRSGSGSARPPLRSSAHDLPAGLVNAIRLPVDHLPPMPGAAPPLPGHVPPTWAGATLLRDLTGHAPQTPITEGVSRFAAWYRDCHGR